MRRQSTLATLAAISLLAIPAIAGSAGASGPRISEHDRIVAHWTPARLKAAVPRDFVEDAGGARPEGEAGRRGGTSTGSVVDRRRPDPPGVRQGLLRDGRRRLRLLRFGGQRLPKRLLAGPDRRALRLRRGRRGVRDELALHPELRRGADVHLRQHRPRLLDRPGAGRPPRLCDRGRLQHPGDRPRLRVRGRRAGRQDRTASWTRPSARSRSHSPA